MKRIYANMRLRIKISSTFIQIQDRKGTPFERLKMEQMYSPNWCNLFQPPVVYGPSGSGELKIKAKNGQKSRFVYYLMRLMCIDAHLMRIEKLSAWPSLIPVVFFISLFIRFGLEGVCWKI